MSETGSYLRIPSLKCQFLQTLLVSVAQVMYVTMCCFKSCLFVSLFFWFIFTNNEKKIAASWRLSVMSWCCIVPWKPCCCFGMIFQANLFDCSFQNMITKTCLECLQVRSFNIELLNPMYEARWLSRRNVVVSCSLLQNLTVLSCLLSGHRRLL